MESGCQKVCSPLLGSPRAIRGHWSWHPCLFIYLLLQCVVVLFISHSSFVCVRDVLLPSCSIHPPFYFSVELMGTPPHPPFFAYQMSGQLRYHTHAYTPPPSSIEIDMYILHSVLCTHSQGDRANRLSVGHQVNTYTITKRASLKAMGEEKNSSSRKRPEQMVSNMIILPFSLGGTTGLLCM